MLPNTSDSHPFRAVSWNCSTQYNRKLLRSVLLMPPMGLMSALEQSYLVKYPVRLEQVEKKAVRLQLFLTKLWFSGYCSFTITSHARSAHTNTFVLQLHVYSCLKRICGRGTNSKLMSACGADGLTFSTFGLRITIPSSKYTSSLNE